METLVDDTSEVPALRQIQKKVKKQARAGSKQMTP